MNTDRDDPLLRRARTAFDAAVDDVDPAAANRLRLARRAALSRPDSPRGWLLPLAGAAAMGLVAWLAWPRAQAPATAPGPVASIPAAPAPSVVAIPEQPVMEDRLISDEVIRDEVAHDAASPDAASPDPDIDAPIDEQLPIDDDTDWAALDDEDAEVYAWLADAPVAPDDEGDAL